MNIQRQAILLSFVATLIVGFLLARVLIGIKFEQPTLPADHPNALYQEYEDLLETYATPRGIRYEKLSKDILYEKVYGFFAYQGPRTSPDLFPTEKDALAYDINAYNALMRIALSRHWPLESPFDIKGPVELTPGFGIFQGRRFLIDGKKLSLIALDKRIRNHPAYDVRASLALACGARSCPYVQAPAFRGERLEEQLDQVIQRTLRERRSVEIDEETQEIRILPIFFMYQGDIEAWLDSEHPGTSFEDWLVSQTADPARLHALREEGYRVVSQELDWEIDKNE